MARPGGEEKLVRSSGEEKLARSRGEEKLARPSGEDNPDVCWIVKTRGFEGPGVRRIREI